MRPQVSPVWESLALHGALAHSLICTRAIGLKDASTRANGQPALAPPGALASRFAANSYRSAMHGYMLIAFRAGK
jgi:hypothetical protein